MLSIGFYAICHLRGTHWCFRGASRFGYKNNDFFVWFISSSPHISISSLSSGLFWSCYLWVSLSQAILGEHVGRLILNEQNVFFHCHSFSRSAITTQLLSRWSSQRLYLYSFVWFIWIRVHFKFNAWQLVFVHKTHTRISFQHFTRLFPTEWIHKWRFSRWEHRTKEMKSKDVLFLIQFCEG